MYEPKFHFESKINPSGRPLPPVFFINPIAEQQAKMKEKEEEHLYTHVIQLNLRTGQLLGNPNYESAPLRTRNDILEFLRNKSIKLTGIDPNSMNWQMIRDILSLRGICVIVGIQTDVCYIVLLTEYFSYIDSKWKWISVLNQLAKLLNLESVHRLEHDFQTDFDITERLYLEQRDYYSGVWHYFDALLPVDKQSFVEWLTNWISYLHPQDLRNDDPRINYSVTSYT